MTRKRRLIMAAVFAATVAACAAAFILILQNRLEKKLEEKYSIISSGIYDAVENEISTPIYVSLTMANNEFLVNLLKNEDGYTEDEAVEQVSAYLSALKNVIGAQTTFLISRNTSRYYTYEGLYKIVNPSADEHDVWYPIFVNSRKPYDIDVDCDQLNGNNWTVFVNARVEDEDKKLLGVCGLGMSMYKLQELLQQYESDYSIKVNFINSEGLIQVDTDSVNIENAYLHDVQYGREKDGYTYKNGSGEFVVMRFVERLNWYLVIHGKSGVLTKSEVLPVVFAAVLLVVLNCAVLFALDRNRAEKL